VNDYLSSLITRNINPKGELQPRLGSIFEPLLPRGGAVTGSIFDLPGDEVEPTPVEMLGEALAPPLRPARRQGLGEPFAAGDLPASSLEVKAASPGAATAASDRQPSGTAPMPLAPVQARTAFRPPASHSSPTLVPLQGQGSVLAPAPSAPLVERAPRQASWDKPTVSLPAAEEESPAEPSVGAMARRGRRMLELAPRMLLARYQDKAGEAETMGAPRSSPAEGERHTALEPAMTRPEPRPADGVFPAAAAPITALPRVKPYLGPTPPAPAQAAAQLEPTIQVTIGRIEVRATPPAQPPKQRSEPPVMSLDEYLRQRSGERR
jgi:hypothetical protein